MHTNWQQLNALLKNPVALKVLVWSHIPMRWESRQEAGNIKMVPVISVA